MNGDWDKTTHAYWAKDTPDSPDYKKARQLATDHIVKEIEKLWSAAKNNEALKEIYGMSMSDMKSKNVYSNENTSQGVTPISCTLCPSLGSWNGGNYMDINAPSR